MTRSAKFKQAQQVASDIDDQLESVEESFDLPGIDDLRQVAQNMDAALQTAQSCASTLIALASGAIVEARTDEAQPQGRCRGPLDQDRP